MERKTDSILQDGIKAILLDIDCAEVTVRMDDIQDIRVEAEVEPDVEYQSEVLGDKFYVRYQWRNREKHIIKDRDMTRIIVTLPKEKVFSLFELKIGAGKAFLQETELCCGTIRIETGAGRVRAGKMNADDCVDVGIGAGSVEVMSLQTRRLNVECGVGRCDIELRGKETDYNYDISCGIGKVSVNGNRTHGIGSTHSRISSDALGNIKVNCGLGKVNIRTA